MPRSQVGVRAAKAKAKEPSEMAYCGHASEAKPEAQLGESRSQSKEPRRVGCGKSPQVGTCGSRQLRIVNYALCIKLSIVHYAKGCELYRELSVNFKMALWGGVAAILCTSVNSIVNFM